MRQDDILLQGVELMLFGVSAVVIFLSLLVLVIGLTSRVIARFFPEPAPAPRAVAGGSAGSSARPTPDAERLAAISAALHHHRQRRRNG